VAVTLSSEVLFETGSAQLRPEALRSCFIKELALGAAKPTLS
jgi:flagellar motor protein MotB